jgi:hypothetical protein
MELSLATLDTFRPKTGSLEQWNAAYVRVEDYLRAHRLHNRLHLSRLIQLALIAAAQEHEKNPAQDPAVLAIEAVDRLMDDWFGQLLDRRDLPHNRIATEGRVAMLLADGIQRWPYAFLESRNLPPEFVQAMRKSSVQAGPDLEVSSMVPRDIDLGVITEAAGETLEQIERLPIVRVLLLWACFAAALAAVFYNTR